MNFHGCGYMTEALIGGIKYLKQNHVTKVVSYFCAEEHLASQRLMKAGFKQDNRQRIWARFPMLDDQLHLVLPIEWNYEIL